MLAPYTLELEHSLSVAVNLTVSLTCPLKEYLQSDEWNISPFHGPAKLCSLGV